MSSGMEQLHSEFVHTRPSSKVDSSAWINSLPPAGHQDNSRFLHRHQAASLQIKVKPSQLHPLNSQQHRDNASITVHINNSSHCKPIAVPARVKSAATLSQPTVIVQALTADGPPSGEFYQHLYSATSKMDEDALAQRAAAVLQRQADLGASVHDLHDLEEDDGQADDSLLENGENSDPFTPRRGNTHKRDEPPPRNHQGKIICRFQNTCANVTFDRKCEWSKHMDKHERPYKCDAVGCEKLQGFTYSGGLLRHQREVHKMHGGTKEPLFCPFPNCKRNQGTGFTRKENRDEHIRRVHRRATDGTDLLSSNKRDHTSMETTDPLLDASVLQSHDNTQDIANENIDPNVTSPNTNLHKRRRLQANGNSILEYDGDLELKNAIKRLQESNQFLFKQNQRLQDDVSRLSERVIRLESDLGSHLVSAACAIDTRMGDVE